MKNEKSSLAAFGRKPKILSTPRTFGVLGQTNLFGTFAGLGAGLSMASEARVSPESAIKGGESPSSISQFFRQLGALTRKNFLSKRRSKLQLVSER